MKKKECSLFDEMLMWTSYRYCIGRRSYVSSMARDMARRYYGMLSDERLEFTSFDIRREIMDRMRFLPFDFNIHRMLETDPLDPIDALMRFIEDREIKSLDEMLCFSRIDYDSHDDSYKYEKKIPTINSYFSISDIEDLLPWDELASCFDIKRHRKIKVKDGKTYTCFKAWRRKAVPCEESPGFFRNAEFGWEQGLCDVR